MGLYSSTVVLAAHVLIVAAVAIRVIMRRPDTGVALAWLLVVAGFPYGGLVLYLLIGERRISSRRARRLEGIRTEYRQVAVGVVREGLADVDWSQHAPAAAAMDRLGRTTTGWFTVRGSELEPSWDTQETLRSIARDVDAAKSSVLMEFYIWNEGGAADEVLEAVIRAAGRGVACCVLVDALGARPWWKGAQPGRLRDAGVEVRPALPVGLLRTLFGRTDLRLHRKIVVIDGEIAWTGSMNLVDPRFFKQGAGVGEWIDAMVRVRGAAVAALGAVMVGDWAVETGEAARDLAERAGLDLVGPQGAADIQVIPTGPGATRDGLLQMVLALINAAQRELVLTTPYLVPDDSMIYALRGAAARGVRVALIVPERVDSLLTRYASRSYYDDLLELGVEIHQYRKGLLHTKSIVADASMSMFGTVNLDMRSLWLNYEVSLFVYGEEFAAKLRALQQSYLEDSDRLDPEAWAARPYSSRFLENALRLLSPLL